MFIGTKGGSVQKSNNLMNWNWLPQTKNEPTAVSEEVCQMAEIQTHPLIPT